MQYMTAKEAAQKWDISLRRESMTYRNHIQNSGINSMIHRFTFVLQIVIIEIALMMTGYTLLGQHGILLFPSPTVRVEK